MQFNKLKLVGFKSFVESTELEIAPGLTGIVGPNGCGKSNLVEALRWVMGETSAKQMRGAGMDDVIFGGTSDRPARNVAEVSLSLDNADRTAPPQFNSTDDLDVTRRIEREKGSVYRVNGSDVRARDVQILFADQATGPRSTALVSQGRIGALIAAKPADRRLLLEEAAGITGLHSRRHEAELRLRAAENNLERLDDVLVTLDAQLQGIKKQVRQARRYKNVSQDIRKTEAVVLHHRWSAATAELAGFEQALRETEAAVAERTRAVSEANRVREAASEALVPVREGEAEASAELQRLSIARNELDAEERRVEAAVEQWSTRLQQIGADLARERELAQEARTALERLAGERGEIERACEGEEAMIAEAREGQERTAAAVQQLEGELTALTEAIAAREAQAAALTKEISELESREARLRNRHDEVAAERTAIEQSGLSLDALGESEAKVSAAEEAMSAARGALETAQQARDAAEQRRDGARDDRARADEILSRLKAEAGALDDLLAGEAEARGGDWIPLIDQIRVTPGYEGALGSALGDDLDAPADEAAPRFWLPYAGAADPALPAGTEPLARFVDNPGPLARRLAQIGLVDGLEEGARLAPTLKVGQRLVDRAGNLWRWDGFVARAESRSAVSARLDQRNRLDELRGRMASAETGFAEADARYKAAQDAAAQALEGERAARRALEDSDGEANAARRAHADLSRELAARTARHENLGETLNGLAGEIEETAAALAQARERAGEIGDAQALRDDAGALRARLGEARAAQHAAQAEHDRLTREAGERRRRIAAIAAEETSWQARDNGAGARVAELVERESGARGELDALAERPAQIAEQRGTLMDRLEAAEAKRNEAADAVARAEAALGEADKALRAAEGALGEARENKVRAESGVVQARQVLQTVCERIAERLECAPAEALAQAELSEGAALPELEASERRLERLLRERDNMGPVNLRAEQEAEELQEKIDTINTEREDLVAAIERLRRGISSLNREARQRLVASFKEVDEHFRELFVKLFGGGQARLELTESDDPLEAGLEIFASPPGKKMQVLSLLSGGEQALTAISLLFAVFLTNPAPICVLDEVDAPLDDANVDRFCRLLDHIGQTGTTRFLVVTHHRMTMARMDRLYGVTMPERGVSQLVSVDLHQVEEIRATA